MSDVARRKKTCYRAAKPVKDLCILIDSDAAQRCEHPHLNLCAHVVWAGDVFCQSFDGFSQGIVLCINDIVVVGNGVSQKRRCQADVVGKGLQVWGNGPVGP